jgi:hypothetical protein
LQGLLHPYLDCSFGIRIGIELQAFAGHRQVVLPAREYCAPLLSEMTGNPLLAMQSSIAQILALTTPSAALRGPKVA